MGQEYEKLGAFYLGKDVDLQTGQPTEDNLLYDSRDLTALAWLPFARDAAGMPVALWRP